MAYDFNKQPGSHSEPGPSFSRIGRVVPLRTLQLGHLPDIIIPGSYTGNLIFTDVSSYTFDGPVYIMGVTLISSYSFAAGTAQTFYSAVARNPGTPISIPDITTTAIPTGSEILAFNFYRHFASPSLDQSFSKRTSVAFDLPFLPTFSSGDKIGIGDLARNSTTQFVSSMANIFYIYQRDLNNVIQ